MTMHLFKNEKQTGISFHLITSNVDSGNIILQKKFSSKNLQKPIEMHENTQKSSKSQ